ncbi:MAG: T9SS type A sorting domain-containing protein [Hymenobacter sp.]|nr:MAG: T9SS type A sorting domain-containing protein [Hymenobacter sp.]
MIDLSAWRGISRAQAPATLSGVAPGASVGIFDALGRRVATAAADASGTAPLPAGLAPGVYVVRAGTSTVRWVVE